MYLDLNSAIGMHLNFVICKLVDCCCEEFEFGFANGFRFEFGFWILDLEMDLDFCRLK
jgi:hypothetical protein